MTTGKLSLGTFASLGIRDFRLLWMGQVSTSLGQWMDQVTRGYLVYTMTGSALDTGAVTALRGLPLLLFGVVAGALADRSGRKAQLIIAQVTNAILNVALAVLVVTGHVQVWHVYLSAFLAGTVQAFQQPARQTLISDIVGNDKLLNALALNSAALNGSRALGPAFAGLFIAAVSVSGSYFVQAFMYAFATIWTIQMHVPEVHTGGRSGRRREPFFTSIVEGLKYVSTQPSTRTQLLLALGPLTFAMSYTAMMPVIALELLHGNSETQGWLLGSIGIGALAGALVVASMRRSHAYGLPVVLGALAFSGSVFVFASSHWLWLSLLLGLVVGAFSVTYTTQDQTLIQVSTPAYIRGRVMSIYLLNRGTVPLGALLAGILADRFGVVAALHITSGIAMAIVGIVVLNFPQILKLAVPLRSDAEWEAEEAARSDGVAVRAGRA